MVAWLEAIGYNTIRIYQQIRQFIRQNDVFSAVFFVYVVIYFIAALIVSLPPHYASLLDIRKLQVVFLFLLGGFTGWVFMSGPGAMSFTGYLSWLLLPILLNFAPLIYTKAYQPKIYRGLVALLILLNVTCSAFGLFVFAFSGLIVEPISTCEHALSPDVTVRVESYIALFSFEAPDDLPKIIIFLLLTDDNGATWEQLAYVTTSADPRECGHMRQLENNANQIEFANHTAMTEDGGQSWLVSGECVNEWCIGQEQ
ncbi:MAG: hypothetical protein H7175_18265 [Burkholderiales bacterium]|nr:hypothetical protein [Anaerolineae bacterium]